MSELERQMEAKLLEAAAAIAAAEQATPAALAAKEQELVCLRGQLEALQSHAGAQREQALSSLQVRCVFCRGVWAGAFSCAHIGSPRGERGGT